MFIVYYLFKLIAVGKLNPLNWFILSICAVVSSLFRLHTLPIILLLFFCTTMILAFKHQIKNTLILILLSVIVLTSCHTTQRVVVKVTVKSLTEDINESIVDGFYNGDTTGLMAKGVLIK